MCDSFATKTYITIGTSEQDISDIPKDFDYVLQVTTTAVWYSVFCDHN
jgi:hypothetical protein